MQDIRDNTERLRIALAIADHATEAKDRMDALKRAEGYAHEIQRDIASVKALLLMLPGEQS